MDTQNVNSTNIDERIIKLLAKEVLAEKAKIDHFYNTEINVKHPVHKKYVSLLKIDKINKQFDILNDDNTSFQIDLPYLISKEKSPSKTVMILAQDAKRKFNKKDFNANKDIILSVPFSFQEVVNQQLLAKPSNYIKLIDLVLNLGKSVYLTDIFKIYYFNKKDKKVSSELWKDNEVEAFGCILKDEIKIINPEIIIVMGLKAKESIKKVLGIKKNLDNVISFDYENKTKIIFIPHISPIVTGQITTIQNLFLGLGEIFSNNNYKKVGKNINKYNIF